MAATGSTRFITTVEVVDVVAFKASIVVEDVAEVDTEAIVEERVGIADVEDSGAIVEAKVDIVGGAEVVVPAAHEEDVERGHSRSGLISDTISSRLSLYLPSTPPYDLPSHYFAGHLVLVLSI